ncbi:MAG: PEP-CTERM sorting domain-containing protein [Pirellulaceae bacterium]
MRNCLIFAVCLVGAAGRGGIASADIVQYYFLPELGEQSRGSVQFADVAPVVGPRDFAVTLSGSTIGCTPNADVDSAKAYLDKWGLGVLNPQAGRDTGIQGQVQLNGKNGGEYLRLEFPLPVQLTKLTFASVGLADTVTLLADGERVDVPDLFPGTTTIRSISDSQGNWPGEVDFTTAAQPTGFAKVWEIRADRPDLGDGVQLENIRAVPVPEPSTFLLLCLGGVSVACIAALRRLAACR